MIGLLALIGTLHAAPVSRTLQFDDDLRQAHDISLQGLYADRTVHFSLPQAWSLTEDPQLTLHFEHSGVLVPERSHLTILINDKALASVRLDTDNAIEATAVVTVPRELLAPWNDLRFSVTQHLDEPCEDPFDPALWTRLSTDSSLALTYEVDPVAPQLLDWPYPIFDHRGYGPLSAAFQLPQDPDPSALDAAGELALFLGRLAGYRGTSLAPGPATLAAATTPVIRVGLQGDLAPLSGFVPPALSPGEGAVALVANPHDATLPVLVVTGADATGLSAAVQALTSPDHHAVLSGTTVVVRDVVPAPLPPVRDVPLPVPEHIDRFTLADLGLSDQTVRGFYAPSVIVPLRFEGDSHPMEDQAELYLDFAYGAQVDPTRSRLEVRLNGIPLRAWALDEIDGQEQQRVRLALPVALLEPASVLEVAFRLVPRGRAGCVQIRDRQLWATVFDTTELRVPRDRYADLPDLGRLQYDFWPYGRDLDEGVVIVLPDLPDRHSLSAALNLAAHLGRMGSGEAPSLALVRAGGSELARRPERHAVLVVDGGTHSVQRALIASELLAPLPPATDRGWTGSVQQIAHPWQEGGTILAVAAPSGTALAAFADGLRTFRQQHLMDTFAIFGPDGHATHFEARTPSRVGSLSGITWFRLVAERGYPLVGLGVLLAGIVLAISLRRWAAVRGGAL